MKVVERRFPYQRMLDFTAALHRAGVPLVAGTDSLPGLGLHREVALYVVAGIPAAEALRIATWNGALYAGESATRGRMLGGATLLLQPPGPAAIAPARLQTFRESLIDGDPSVNITDLRRASLVIQGRVAYMPAQLYETMGFKPFVPGARLETPAP